MHEFDQVRSLIEYMIRGFVDKPEEVRVNAAQQEAGMLYHVMMAHEDIDKVIGKQGSTVRSIRIIISAIGAKLNQRLSLEIGE
jgi:predicted RNA-binding protein YlqC (UPF0109 family)